jgi:hypothetical protein
MKHKKFISLNVISVGDHVISIFGQTRSQLWAEVAEKITIAVQQIIEFAKMLPGFMDLSQDDQIMLLKAGQRRM